MGTSIYIYILGCWWCLQSGRLNREKKNYEQPGVPPNILRSPSRLTKSGLDFTTADTQKAK